MRRMPRKRRWMPYNRFCAGMVLFAPPLNVAFDITLKEGGLWGTSARLASIAGGRRKQAARKSGKKKSPANKRRR